MTRIRHIILTRLGIGVARPSFYAQHIALLEQGLLKSMRAQTCQNFEWYVCADRQIDTGSRKRLKNLLAGHDNFHLFLADPIAKGHISPRYRDLPASDAEMVLMSRIDDDDALHRDCVALLQDEACKRVTNTASFSMGFNNGLRIDPVLNKYRMVDDSKSSVMLTTVFSPPDALDVYSFNHAKIDVLMQEKGLAHHAINTIAPMWIYTRRSTSDSGTTKAAGRNFTPVDDAARAVMHQCGLEDTWPQAVEQIVSEMPDTALPMIGTPTMRRLQMKNALLAQIRVMKKNDQKDTDAYRAMVTAFYAI